MTASDMHLAHFIQRYPPALGGSESYFARLTRFHQSHGDTVTVWTTTAVELAELWKPTERTFVEEESVRRYRPLAFPARRYLLKAASLIPLRRWQALTLPCNPICPTMWRDAARFRGPLDAVHAACLPYTFPLACGLRLARSRGVPFFLTPFLHLGDPANPNDPTRRQYLQPAMRWLLHEADGLFVQTETERQAVINLGVRESRVVLQGLGVDPADCTGGDREATRARWGFAPDELVIGHLANLSEEKGTVDLLKANLPHPIVLAGPTMPNFERFWASSPRLNPVTRLGVLSESQKRDFFAAIDLFCLPSRTDSFGLVLLEAWANRKPVLVYRAGGPAELVRDGVDGYVVDCSPAALARPLNRETLRELGEAGHTRVLSEFRWPEKLAQVRDRLKSVGRDLPGSRARL